MRVSLGAECQNLARFVPNGSARPLFGFGLDFLRYNTVMTRAIFIALLITLANPALSDGPEDADWIGPEAALACVAARYQGEALMIRSDDDDDVQELRWLTPAGNVLRIWVTGPGCRFVEVDGVGQTEARILPGMRE
jgi:hypothetical protein